MVAPICLVEYPLPPIEELLTIPPSVSSTVRENRTELTAAGSWTALHAAELEKLVDAANSNPALMRATAINMQGIEAFDTYGAWLLERLARAGHTRGQDMRILALDNRYRGLFEEVQHVNREPPAVGETPNTVIRTLETVGRTIEGAGRDLLQFINMLGALGSALVGVVLRPQSFRLTSAVHHLDRVGWQAVPIILLITFLIGGIIAQQGFFHFRKFGADDYVVDMVGILVLRELGVLIVAIMVAGRSGSSYTAEIGSMKMREEIDALRTMGLDPVSVLLLPRVIALVIALPLLTFLGSMAALYGGGVVAWLYGGMSPEIYVARLNEAISVTHFKVGMIKAPFMALAIGIVACAEGLKVKGSAESLGLHTTASVVKSIFLVIVLDGLFAIFFASIGM
jgi:phospholipid/cholesterol/gamma-HCH transport system permease protein